MLSALSRKPISMQRDISATQQAAVPSGKEKKSKRERARIGESNLPYLKQRTSYYVLYPSTTKDSQRKGIT